MNKTQRVKLVAYLSRKLLGYDIFESAKELKHSLENILREKKAKENKDSAEMRRLESEKTALQEECGMLKDTVHSLKQELSAARTNNSQDVRELEKQIQDNEETIQRQSQKIDSLRAERQNYEL